MKYESPYAKGSNNLVRLATNENPYNISDELKKGLLENLEHINLYPTPEDIELKKLIAQKHELAPENVVIGAGADEIISLLAFKYINSENNAIVSKHTFFRYKQLVKLAHGECKEIEEIDFKHNLDEFIKNVDEKTKMIFICNPDNPTGTIISKEEIESFISKISSDIIIVLDEAYIDYAPTNTNESRKDLIKKFPNVVILRTFSKFYRLASLRVGYGIGGEKIIKELNEFRSPYSVNAVALTAAKLVLSQPKDEAYLREIENERSKYYEFFDKNSFKYLQSSTNFIFVSFGTNTKQICEQLREKGIIVRSCNIFGYDNYVRITIGNPEENMRLIAETERIIRGM